ncbi:MAG: MarR family transcriptional regulator [Acuticoccus sp.]
MNGEPPSGDDFSRCLLLNTVKTSRALLRRYDEKLSAHDSSVAQFSVLAAVRYARGRTIHDLAATIAMDRTTLSRNLDLLARKGLIVKEAAGKGNARVCRLTDAGERLLATLIPQWREAQREMQVLLAGRDRDEFLSVLQILARG